MNGNKNTELQLKLFELSSNKPIIFVLAIEILTAVHCF